MARGDSLSSPRPPIDVVCELITEGESPGLARGRRETKTIERCCLCRASLPGECASGGSTRNLRNMLSSAFRNPSKILISTVSTLVVIEAVRLIRLYRSVEGNKRYWYQRASAPALPGDFIYLALGDSVANAIGASRPQNGYVGLIERNIHEKTGRNVHVINVSVTGATTDNVIREQLPKIRRWRPDLVTLDIGANDVNKNLPEVDFMRDFATILDALPAGKTIVADLPTFVRGPKQSTLMRLNAAMHAQIAAHHFEVAPIFEVTSATIHDWRTYGADFFHPSNKGHRNWYRAFEAHVDAIVHGVK